MMIFLAGLVTGLIVGMVIAVFGVWVSLKGIEREGGGVPR